MNATRLRIAYLTANDPRDKRSWSGIHHFLSSALQEHCGDVDFLGPWKPEQLIKRQRATSFLSEKLTGKRFDYTHSTALAKAYGEYFTQKLREKEYNLVFAVAASTELAYLETSLPVFYLADTTIANMLGYYPFYTNLSKRSEAQALDVEKHALQKATHLFYPSDWAAQSAIRDFEIDPARVHVVPLGANLESVPDRAQVLQHADDGLCRLLFLGVEWERKGGPIAMETLDALRHNGINAELTVCGCVPPVTHPYMKVIPFIDKNDPPQQQRLTDLLLKSDFLLLPTRAECYGLVFCEAAAFGVPSVSTDTGGVRGAVHEGKNGFLLSPDAKGHVYAERITELWNDRAAYMHLRESARNLFETSLNWDSWAKTIQLYLPGS